MAHLRSAAQQAKYDAYKAAGGLENGCRLCERKPLKTFKYWRIIGNKFPFDRIAKVHHMIVPKRHVAEPQLRQAEVSEFRRIKEDYLNKKYEFLIEATHLKKSIPEHFHIHLVIVKE